MSSKMLNNPFKILGPENRWLEYTPALSPVQIEALSRPDSFASHLVKASNAIAQGTLRRYDADDTESAFKAWADEPLRTCAYWWKPVGWVIHRPSIESLEQLSHRLVEFFSRLELHRYPPSLIRHQPKQCVKIIDQESSFYEAVLCDGTVLNNFYVWTFMLFHITSLKSYQAVFLDHDRLSPSKRLGSSLLTLCCQDLRKPKLAATMPKVFALVPAGHGDHDWTGDEIRQLEEQI